MKKFLPFENRIAKIPETGNRKLDDGYGTVLFSLFLNRIKPNKPSQTSSL